MKHIAIVLSAGSGKRMGGQIPKQYMDLCGKPVLYYSLKAMQDSFMDEIILVAKETDIEYCNKEIVEKYSFTKVTHIVSGGAERSDSVYNGLKCLDGEEDSYVYVHDGARPCINKELLERIRDKVIEKNAVVCAVPSKDTIKIIDESGKVISTPERKKVWNMQTPQAFKTGILKAAYELMMETEDVSVTDDAMVVELFENTDVYVTEGEYTNLKLTTPEDFVIAEKILK